MSAGHRQAAARARPDPPFRPGLAVREPRVRPSGSRGRDRPLDGLEGRLWDNAVAESFFATLKKELAHRRSWPTRRELASEAFEHIEAFYNRQRRHSTLGYLSPIEFEQASLTPEDEGLATSRLAQSKERDQSPASPTVSMETGPFPGDFAGQRTRP